jgi:LmbE family N-acetylglucosaminyl deacetylase
MLNKKNVLVVAAHSDDEALGCAGTIAKHIASNDNVFLLFMTDGVGSRHVTRDNVIDRQEKATRVAKILSISSMENLNFPDNKMDSVPLLDITQSIEKKISEVKPDIIYTHHIGDLNIDHQITHKAVMTACRPQPGFSVKEIYAFEVLSSTEWQTPGYCSFSPNVYIDITNYIDLKEAVLEVYDEEMREYPHSRSIENVLRVNTVRGNAVGVEYAEAFMLLRMIKSG